MRRFLILTSVLVLLSLHTGELGPVRGLSPKVTTYVVNSDADTPDANPGDGVCDIGAWFSYCTLHAAIQEANLDGVASLITFSSPVTITFPALPALTEHSTTIDASSVWQGTWPQGRPGVMLLGGTALAPQLTIEAGWCTVRGIYFARGTNRVGLDIDSPVGQNTIGGTSTGQRNVFTGGTGVEIGGGGYSNRIVGNRFGTIDGEYMMSSVFGIHVQAHGNYIEDNIIVAHSYAGIYIEGGGGNYIQYGNRIGVGTYPSTALPNQTGIMIREGHNNVVRGNVIGGNTGYGVDLRQSDYTGIVDNTIGGYFPGTPGNGSGGILAINANGGVFDSRIGKNGGHGIWLEGSDDNDIHGSITDNDQDGIYVDGGKRNRVSETDLLRNGGSGVHLATGAISNTVTGNYIGHESGDGEGNSGHGILIDGGASWNRIGGLGTDDGNWIASNGQSGIHIAGATTQGNVVEGNVIGAQVIWLFPASNGHHGISIYDGAHDNWIGWGNVIVSSKWSGVAIVNGSDNNVVWFNTIGTNEAGEDWGNDYWGVNVVNSAGNYIFGNEITYNGQAGVRIDGGPGGNPINANSIHDNDGAGIELVNGGNSGLSAPTLFVASCAGQPQTLGQVQGQSCLDCTVEIFSDTADEGRVFEGSAVADGSVGAFSWSGMLDGPNVTATSTTPTGETSPFSAPTSVGACVYPQIFVPLIVR